MTVKGISFGHSPLPFFSCTLYLARPFYILSRLIPPCLIFAPRLLSHLSSYLKKSDLISSHLTSSEEQKLPSSFFVSPHQIPSRAFRAYSLLFSIISSRMHESLFSYHCIMSIHGIYVYLVMFPSHLVSQS